MATTQFLSDATLKVHFGEPYYTNHYKHFLRLDIWIKKIELKFTVEYFLNILAYLLKIGAEPTSTAASS